MDFPFVLIVPTWSLQKNDDAAKKTFQIGFNFGNKNKNIMLIIKDGKCPKKAKNIL